MLAVNLTGPFLMTSRAAELAVDSGFDAAGVGLPTMRGERGDQ